MVITYLYFSNGKKFNGIDVVLPEKELGINSFVFMSHFVSVETCKSTIKEWLDLKHFPLILALNADMWLVTDFDVVSHGFELHNKTVVVSYNCVGRLDKVHRK